MIQSQMRVRRVALPLAAVMLAAVVADCGSPDVAGNSPTLQQVILVPASASLPAGATQPFVASGKLSDGSTTTPTVTYSATGGTITAGGVYTAGSSAGAYRVIATRQDGSLADTSAVDILAAVLTQVILAPATASIPAGRTQQFAVSGTWSDGSTAPPAVNYSATGGTITPGGLYTAGSTTGTFRVIAVQQGGTLADTAAVTITAPVLTQVILTPATVSLGTGALQQFVVSGKLSDGSTTTPAVTYSQTGGTITPGGLYTAGSTAGTFRVIATQQGGTLADTSAVTITAAPPTLTQVILAPAAVTLSSGGTQQFTVSGMWSDGSTTAPAVTYSATGGAITAGGLYTAGSSAGAFRVIATQQGGTLADTSAVTITTGQSYTTSFPLTENPISEGGKWIGGFTPGLQWSNVQTTPGLAFGRQQLDVATTTSDGTAILTGTWGADQSAEAVVKISTMPHDNYFAEVELRLRSTITANVNNGYEVSWKATDTPGSAYLILVRWNGAHGDYTYLNASGTFFGSAVAVQNGDVVKATIIGNILRAYKNGVLQASADITATPGSVWTSGTPGIGFNLEAAGAGHNQDYGYSSFTATDTP